MRFVSHQYELFIFHLEFQLYRSVEKMIHLHISEQNPKHIAIKERLEHLSLAREVICDSTLDEAILVHSGKTFTGTQEITAYLDEFEQFHSQWYNCHCG